jgi:predicted metalloprotease with PDZ domain
VLEASRTTLSLTLTVLLSALTGLLPPDLNGAEMPDAISYTLRFPAPETHYVEVEAHFPTGGQPEIELMMPVWTPGSYVVREFSRNVEALTATPHAIRKTAKNRWRVETGGEPRVTVRYRVYSHEMSVRTNFVDASFALLNGASTFLTPVGLGQRPHEVEIVPPPGWRQVITPLPTASGPHTFRAADYDTLVDSPIYAGNAEVREIEVAGKKHLLVSEGGEGAWNGAKAAAGLEKLIAEEIAFWGFAPYSRYVFFNLLTEEGGGLEHKDSTVLMSGRFRARTRDGLIDWLGLAGHEMFHAWNVKRLRPVELDHFDYEHEVYTESLWVAEGLTSYYDDLLIARAGLMRRDDYFKRLSKQIDGLETSPGRLVQPLSAASFDAWIKYYRRDENFANSGVSYYTKGAVVGFLLDAEIRRATGGTKSLDDAMRLAYQRYSGERGYTPAELRKTLEEVAGTDLTPFWTAAVDSAGDLDYQRALDWFGLRFGEYKDEKDEGAGVGPRGAGAATSAISATSATSATSPTAPSVAPAGPPGKDTAEELPKELVADLGIDTEVEKGRLVVTVVRRGTTGYQAGINAGDEILAIDDYRVPPEGFRDRLKAYRPGDKATLLVARRERLTRLPVIFGEKPPRKWRLEPDPKATPEQKQHLADWLRPATVPAPEPVSAAPATSRH